MRIKKIVIDERYQFRIRRDFDLINKICYKNQLPKCVLRHGYRNDYSQNTEEYNTVGYFTALEDGRCYIYIKKYRRTLMKSCTKEFMMLASLVHEMHHYYQYHRNIKDRLHSKKFNRQVITKFKKVVHYVWSKL